MVACACLIGTACDSNGRAELLGDWWETYHTYDGMDIDPARRLSFHADGSGQDICSTALAGDLCNDSELRRFDWTILSEGKLEKDVRPLLDGTDFLPVTYDYTIEDGVLEMRFYDALDYLSVFRYTQTPP